MDVFTVQDDGSEQLLASGLNVTEVEELQEWWRYTKRLGSDIKIVVRTDFETTASLISTGTEPGLAVAVRHPEIFIG